MRKFLLSAALLTALFVMMQSCHKDVQTEMIKEIVIDTTIKAGSDYTLNLAPLGTEDNIANILDKGKQFSVSQLENETDMFTSVYHYASNAKAKGTDQVVLSVSQNPNGNHPMCRDSTIVYINFTLK